VSLDRLTADEASSSAHEGATIAAHVAHLTYGLSLMNRWAAGEHPFESADWAPAWRVGRVSSAEWDSLRNGLRTEVDHWLVALSQPRPMMDVELNGAIASAAHLAYHLGAVRQIHAGLRGPKEGGA